MIDLERFLQQALEPTLAAIVGMEERVSRSVRSVLAEIREHLVDPEYTVGDLMRNLGASGNNWLASEFKAAMGLTLWVFIQEMRLLVAARLLRDTMVQVADVVMLVGYVDLSSFSRLFQSWCGTTPSGFRKQTRELRRGAGAIPAGIFGWYYWRRCWNVELSVEEVRELVAYLGRLRGLVEAIASAE
jgi:AraC-like DNA-binding protein